MIERDALLRQYDIISAALDADAALTWILQYRDHDHRIDLNLAASQCTGHKEARRYIIAAVREALPSLIQTAYDKAKADIAAASPETTHEAARPTGLDPSGVPSDCGDGDRDG